MLKTNVSYSFNLVLSVVRVFLFHISMLEFIADVARIFLLCISSFSPNKDPNFFTLRRVSSLLLLLFTTVCSVLSSLTSRLFFVNISLVLLSIISFLININITIQIASGCDQYFQRLLPNTHSRFRFVLILLWCLRIVNS